MRKTAVRRRSPRAPLIKELDRLCREVTFARDRHACLKCGRRDRLQWCHVYSRSHVRLRWNLHNVMTLDAGCHLWWHRNPLDALDWWKAKVGPEVAERLSLSARTRPPGKIDLEAIRLYLEQELYRIG